MDKLIFLLPLFLMGCTSNTLVDVSQSVIITPPESFYTCPQYGKLPAPETLTNQQVAEVIRNLYRYNKVCGINMDKIQKFINNAKILEGKKSAS